MHSNGSGGARPAENCTATSRTIALVGPFGSGKTTLFEALLARTGTISKMGDVNKGTSVGDASPEARNHSMSIEANFGSAVFMGDKYTFVDCPGSVEFQYEQQPILAIADLAIVVCEPDEKKIPALQLILRSLEQLKIPHVLFLNKIDKYTTSVRDSLAHMQVASEIPLMIRQIPIWKNGIAIGAIDLALERALIYREHAESEVIPLDDENRERELDARFSMLETLADHDDALMEQLLDDIDPPQDRVFDDLKSDLQNGDICPVFIGSAAHGNGVHRLLKALRHESPGLAETQNRLFLTGGVSATCQTLKTIYTVHGGKLTIARVMQGKMSEGSVLISDDGSEAGRISGVFDILGQKTVRCDSVNEGDIVAFGKLDLAGTGQTLAQGVAPLLTIPCSSPPEPVFSVSLQAKERNDDVKLGGVLTKICEEDPSLSVENVQETGETILHGQGEMHLRVAQERISGKYGIKLVTSNRLIPYRETIRSGCTEQGRHKKQSGGHGQFGDVLLEIRPLERSAGFEFTNTVTGGVVPRQYFSAVEAGVRDILKSGPLGFPVVDISVCLKEGSYHSVDSSEQAFRIAGQVGMRNGLSKCSPVLLEPILRVTIFVPCEITPKVNAIVSQRRGHLLGFDTRPGWIGWDQIIALMPEAEVSDLIIELRSISSGVGSYITRFDHLEELNGRLANDVLEQHRIAAE